MAEDPLSCPVPLLHAFFKAAAAQAPTYPPISIRILSPVTFSPAYSKAEHLSLPESSCYIKCTDQGKAIQAKDGKKPHCNVGSGRGWGGDITALPQPAQNFHCKTHPAMSSALGWGFKHMLLPDCPAEKEAMHTQDGPFHHLRSTP